MPFANALVLSSRRVMRMRYAMTFRFCECSHPNSAERIELVSRLHTHASDATFRQSLRRALCSVAIGTDLSVSPSSPLRFTEMQID